MSKKTTEDFFDKPKQDWSKIKDDLLHCYLRPYANKIFKMGKPILYVDCFAGAGTFEGKTTVPPFSVREERVRDDAGSPFVAFKSFEWAKSESRSHMVPHVKYVFIEWLYSEHLKTAIEESQFKDADYTILKGDFKEHLPAILESFVKNAGDWNLFCYLDPFGIKDLQSTVLAGLANGKFNTTEILMNFNSFGLMRAACAHVGFKIREQEILGNPFYDYEIIKRELDNLTPVASQELFDGIFGDHASWVEIVSQYKKGKIDGYEAERLLSATYKNRLKSFLGYSYALDLPIGMKHDQHPKYRMLHLCDHPDGCVLMGNNMRQRDQVMTLEYKDRGQLSLFDMEDFVDNSSSSISVNVRDSILSLLSNEWQDVTILQARLYDSIGIPKESMAAILKDMEDNGLFDVKREPAVTKTGKPARFHEVTAGNRLWLRKRQEGV